MAAGKKIKIGSGDDTHVVTLPPEETNPKEILFYNEKPENAYWRRQDDFPDTWWAFNKAYTELNQEKTKWDTETGKLLALDRKDTEQLAWFQKREMKRRRDGIWFRNGKQIIWLCGDYYFNLQWGAMLDLPEKYGSYLQFQNDFLILKWYVRNHPNHLGMGVSKPKKTGITQVMSGAIFNEATLLADKQFGIMSKDFKDDTKETNMAMVKHILANLPDILIPGIKKINEQALWFGMPIGKMNSLGVTKSLNTRINAKRTKAAGFDGPKPWLAYIDELPKIYKSAKVRVQQLFEKTLAAVKLQQKKNGIFIWTSYAPEEDDLGFADAKKIVDDSSLSTIGDNPLGRTKSGLIFYHIDALEATFGTHDKYGRANRQEAERLNQAERDQAKGNKTKLQAVIRQGARSKAEAWGIGGISTAFNSIRLGIQIKEIEDEMKSGVPPYVAGKLEWVNTLWEGGKFNKRPCGEFCRVRFIKLTDEEVEAGEEGRLHIFRPLPAKDLNKSVAPGAKKDWHGRLMPAEDSITVGGIDPTDYRFASQVEDGSLNASITANAYDILTDTLYGAGSSNINLSEYFFEPENPLETYEDIVKEIIYWDKRVIVEANKKWLVTKLIEDGLHNFLILRQKDGTLKPYEEGDENSLISTTTDSIDTYVRLIKQYWAEPAIGEIDIDYLKLTKSERLLRQASNFKPEEAKSRKKADLVMAFGLTRLAVESFSTFKKKEDDTIDREGMKAAFAFLNSY